MLSRGKKVVLGMSGGVDSSVSLYLLKKAGFDVVGVSLKYDVWKGCKRENVCCSKESFENAKKVCDYFGVEHHIVDVSQEFRREVIEYFKSELGANRTPSPCVFCNPKVKFAALLRYGDKIGADLVATGHYAQIRHSNEKFLLVKARDRNKDQTYSLSFLTQKELSRIIFPLGQLTKDEVYRMALEMKELSFYKKIKQSQDFCFLGHKDQKRFIAQELAPKSGDIVDEKGVRLGLHEGLCYYTIGQRKGIALHGGPYFVLKKDGITNTLVVTNDEKKVTSRTVILKPFNLIAGDKIRRRTKVMAKLRSTSELAPAEIEMRDDGLVLEFQEPQFAPTSGQVAVFYRGDICLGAGEIN